MKKFLSLISCFLFLSLVLGCSCSKVNEETYDKAYQKLVDSKGYKFRRTESITGENNKSYTYVSEVEFLFDDNKNVLYMSYEKDGSEYAPTSHVLYKYFKDSQTLYKNINSTTTKETGIKYSDRFSIEMCGDSDYDCKLLTNNFIFPRININNVTDFKIEKEGNEAVATFKSNIVNFEKTSNLEQLIDYTFYIDANLNITRIEYSFISKEENNTNSHVVLYEFIESDYTKIIPSLPVNSEKYI